MCTGYRMSVYSRTLFAFLAIIIYQSFISLAVAQESKPVLVIFHGVGETRNDMRELAETSHQTKMFTRVITIGYKWKESNVLVDAPRIFNSLNNRFPNSKFVLLGNKEGGILAEWIATRLEAARGRVIRVITLNSPLDGKEDYKTAIEGVGLRDLAPDSEMIRLLKIPPEENARSSVDFIRLWEKDNEWVAQGSALREPSGQMARAAKIIVRTKPYDPREAIPDMLVQAKKDFESHQYSKVIEACRHILRVEPRHEEANNLIGLSLYNFALGEGNSAKASELFDESLQHLSIAISADQAYRFPVAHHHVFGNTLLDVNAVCYGFLIVEREFLAFVGGGHRFVAPMNRVNLSFNPGGVGLLHVEVGHGKDKRKVYNFFPGNVAKSTAFVPFRNVVFSINEFKCDDKCYLPLQTVYRLIDGAKQLPVPINELSQVNVQTVHTAVRKKNRHTGVMTFSTNGLAWQETGENADPKHNFSVSWGEIKKVNYTDWVLSISYKTKDKGKQLRFVSNGDNEVLILKLIYKYTGAYERFS